MPPSPAQVQPYSGRGISCAALKLAIASDGVR